MPQYNFLCRACKKEFSRILTLSEHEKKHLFGSDRVHSECARSASGLSLRSLWKQCLGRASAVSARRAGVQPPDGVDRNDSQSSEVVNIKAETRADYGQVQHSHA